ncbi:MAG: DUF4982 domain-containing protein [Oscillospiraceae bacterium]|nr:DUF4982 domain-containing protein [Oscillospiraceae bacterium]
MADSRSAAEKFETLFCNDWEFSKNPLGTEYSEALSWKSVDIPHDWLIYDTKNLYETSTGWYRKRYTCTPEPGMCTALRFEGVYMDSKVYVNGKLAGEWKYGYSTFEFDITELLKDGENLITVRVDHQSPNSRWYSGAGIYRKVILKKYPESHILSDGIYISADVSGSVTITAESARPKGAPVAGLEVRETIFDGEKVICTSTLPVNAWDDCAFPEPVRINGASLASNTVTMHIPEPILWDIEAPHLYTLTTELIKDGEAVHTVKNNFGLRKIEFTCDKGFFLNDRHVKLHGCCEHHDLGALGAAVNRSAIKRKLTKLREMGINAIRTSHNMPAVELMELCDEMGFLVLSEGFDMWEMQKTDYDYARFFKEWTAKDVASWVRRDRNHPCLIGWSLGNEIYDTHASDRGQEIASRLMYLVRLHDPRSNGYVTIGSNFMQWDGAQRCADIVKLAGYNYAERLYDEQHKAHPDWMIYGSETSSVVQSRGIYHFPLSEQILCEDDEQCSALGNSAPGWAAKNVEACIIPDRDAEYCAGQFIWTGFDYIGEPTPYSTKNSYFGQYDTAGYAKDSAYIFRSAWTDYKKSPFVHIFPYWDFGEEQLIDVRVATNAPRAALFLNGEKIGEKEIDHLHGKELTLDVNIPYKKGELLAIAYDENGNEIARDVQRSFGDVAELRLTADSDTVNADGESLIFLDITAHDSEGNFVANANNRVFVTVEGAGRLVGLDNGDSTDYEQYKGTSRRLFSGRLLAMIAANTGSGEINVTVTSPSLPESRISLRAEECAAKQGVSSLEMNTPREFDCTAGEKDIPIRRIELLSDSRTFTPDRQEITFKTAVYPSNASYADEIEYRVTTAIGIPSNMAEIVSSENGTVTVKCHGDGEFYLRALCKNGTEKYHIITPLRLTGEGLGAASFDPYEYVTAGLYSVSGGTVANGIERGAAFVSENSWFGFENVDFGAIGSDEITISFFANCTTPVNIRFYDGSPDEGGEMIGEFSYWKQPIWLTYQNETFKLTKNLRGVHTIVMQSEYRYDVGGFVFTKPEKEFAEINAVWNDEIYGDKFTVEENAVTGIGNNVMLNFGEFDFTDKAPARVVITGRSALPQNSIHVIFTGDTEKRVLAEFTASPDYAPQSFELSGISGKCKVSFAFLPGSDFDFRSFRFEA